MNERTSDEKIAEWKKWIYSRFFPHGNGNDLLGAGALSLLDLVEQERKRADLAETKLKDWEERFPCDGGCFEEPEETCSRDGRTPADLWRIITEERLEAAEMAHRFGVTRGPF